MRGLKKVFQERRSVQINVRHHNFYTKVAVGFIANTKISHNHTMTSKTFISIYEKITGFV